MFPIYRALFFLVFDFFYRVSASKPLLSFFFFFSCPLFDFYGFFQRAIWKTPHRVLLYCCTARRQRKALLVCACNAAVFVLQ